MADPQRSAPDDEEPTSGEASEAATSDGGGDSDPSAHEGFAPPDDEGRDLVTPA
jgi:hypothetical protein